MLRCSDVVTLLAADTGAAPRVRVQLALHLVVCRHCRTYARALRAIHRAARSLYRRAGDGDTRVESLVIAVRAAAQGP